MNGSTPLPLYATASTPPSSPSKDTKRSTSGTSQVTLSRKRTHRLKGGSSASGSWQKSASGSGFPSLVHGSNGNPSSRLYAFLYSRNSPLQILRPANLTARARTTNLAVLLLVLALMLSFLYNVRYYLHEHALPFERDRMPLSIRATLPQGFMVQAPTVPQGEARRKIEGVKQEKVGVRLVQQEQRGSEGIFKTSQNAETLNFASLNHLILVPGHAVWKGRSGEEAHQDENWVLESVQRGGSVQTFIKHIMKGAELAIQDPNSLLVFSGGQTRTMAQETEGDSYYRLAEALDLYRQYDTPRRPGPGDFARTDQTQEDTSVDGKTDTAAVAPTAAAAKRVDRQLFPRATTEQFALDSYQNLLFSICRFKEMTGRYPTKITVVGFGMKRSRFSDIHRRALKFPDSAFTYIGIDDVGETGQSYLGEKEYGLKPYSEDIYGCKGFLLGKRRARNPHRRIHPYFTSNPLLRDLIEYCPMQGKVIFPGSLPWDTGRSLS